MGNRSFAELIIAVLLGTLVIAFIGGRIMDQPVLLSYVVTGSMEPTLAPGDGFVVIPSALAGEIGRGDVIVFQAQQLHGGGLTTHRVIDQTAEGFVTKGDANPFTDQSGGEPPVKRSQIVGVVPSIAGQLLVIPYLGAPILAAGNLLTGAGAATTGLIGGGTQGLAYALFALGVGVYGASLLSNNSDRERARDDSRQATIDTRLVVIGLTALVVLGVTASMVVASGTQTFDVISADNDAPGPGVIPAGESETVRYTIRNDGLLPVSAFVEPGENVDITKRAGRIGRGEKFEANVTLTAPSENGYYTRTVNEHWYLGILPHSTIRALFRIHPWLPVIVIDLLVGAGFAALATGGLDLSRQRLRDRSREGRSEWWPFGS